MSLKRLQNSFVASANELFWRRFFCLFFSALFLFSSISPLQAAPLKVSFPNKTVEAADKEPQSDVAIYDVVPEKKSLLTSLRFKVVDDFNRVGSRHENLKNYLGGIWHLRGTEAKNVLIDRVSHDGRNPFRGHSMRVKFELEKQQQVIVQSSLMKIDMSQADYLVMKCRVQDRERIPFTGRIRVSLKDWRGIEVKRDVTSECMDAERGEWSEALIPMNYFKTLDLDQLREISIKILSRGNAEKAAFYLDELAFFGDNEVEFESTRDNLAGFPKTIIDQSRINELKKIEDDREFLKEVAYDTWKFFNNAVNEHNYLVVDHIRLGDAPLAANYTSPTNIAMDLLATISGHELGFITKQEALDHIGKHLKTLRDLKKWRGFFYNFYETTKMTVTRNFVSSVDNGWLALALVVVRQAFNKRFYSDATTLLEAMDYEQFLDYENYHLFIGFDTEKNEFTETHYGLLMSEARATSFLAIGKGDLTQSHWWSLYRTAPKNWAFQNQKPRGQYISRDAFDVFQGYYVVKGERFVPSWGGSMFEHLMPTILMDEKNLAPDNFGHNNILATRFHIEYAKEKGYPFWGISPAATTNGRTWSYGEYGIKEISIKGYPDRGVVTPHASFLALDTLPEEAIKNIRVMLDHEMYGEYGFYDSKSFVTGKVNHQYLALDQGMSLLAVTNYLTDGAIKKLFHSDPIAQEASKLWEKEAFYER